MRIETTRGLLLAATAVALAGCTNADGRFDLSQTDPSWGEANRATMAAQVVDPAPEYADPIPPTSASNAVRAIDAYRDGRVEEVEDVSTTDIGGGSGGGSGGSV